MWIPPEDADPVVLHAPTRKSISVFGAVCVSDGRFVSRLEKKFNACSFQNFLAQLVRHRRKGRKMIVVVDNARWHHANQLKPWLNKYRDVLRLDFLPPYSPDLNPIERVWKLTRRLCTHNRYFSELDELLRVVSYQFDQWKIRNEPLRKLCAII
jgi:transposase